VEVSCASGDADGDGGGEAVEVGRGETLGVENEFDCVQETSMMSSNQAMIPNLIFIRLPFSCPYNYYTLNIIEP